MRSAPPPASRPPSPARRVLLTGGLGATLLTLAGCRVRLEDDAPQIPFIPTREPIPAEPALLWLLRDSRDLAAATAAGSDGFVELYEEQVRVLRTALYRAGIPIETLDAALAPPATPTGTMSTAATTTSTGTTASTRTDAAATTGAATPSETPANTATASATTPATEPTPTPAPTDGPAAALRRIDDLEQCGPGIFPFVASVLGQRWAAVTTGGAEVPDRAHVDPEHRWQFPHLASSFVELTRPAVYGFQVVAAQSREETRESALRALAAVRELLEVQTTRAGGAASSPPIAYPLPFPVNSPETAARLATHLLDGLVGGYGGLLTTVTGSAQSDSARDVIGWIGSAAAVGGDWGLPPTAFPGLRAPG